MLNQRTFSEIFTQIHNECEKQNIISEYESLLEPAWLAQVMAAVGPLQFKTNTLYRHHSYPKQNRKKPQRTPHLLNESEQMSYEFLKNYKSHELSPAFNLQELKSAYRMALLKTHPDQGGHAETFQQVRKSYEILKSFVTKET